MQTIQALMSGITQGLSEFLPISSSAHITFSNFFLNHFLNTVPNKQEEIFFDIIVHLGTLFAVLIYFFNDLKTICKDFFTSVKKNGFLLNGNFNKADENTKLVYYIMVSSFVTGIIGFLIKNPVESLIQNPKYICIFLFLTGLILLLSEKLYSSKSLCSENKKLNLKKMILIGIAQGLAVFPGFSRSGLTISTALFLGINRVDAARISFLMSIPVIFLASMVYPLLEFDFNTVIEPKPLIIGFFASFVSGYFCIKYFMKLLKKLSLRIFGYYCLLVACTLYFVLN